MAKIEGFKGGKHEIGTIKHKQRYKDGGKLCYGCDKVRKVEEYYTTSTRCKHCMNKKNRERYKKQNQSLW